MSEPTQTTPPALVVSWAKAADLPPEADRPTLPEGGRTWEQHLEHASEVLFLLSGRRYAGVREGSAVIEARRSSLTPPPFGWDASWGVCLQGGEVYNVCPCSGRAQVRLPDSPIVDVHTVTINGEELSPLAYELVGDRWLRRLDGRRWETCRGDLVVDYSYGSAPPRVGVEAVVAFALELGKLAAGDASTKITRKAQNITRQGVTVSGFDPNDYLDRGRTGVELADLFLAAVNAPPPRDAWVWSPDLDPYPSYRVPLPPRF